MKHANFKKFFAIPMCMCVSAAVAQSIDSETLLNVFIADDTLILEDTVNSLDQPIADANLVFDNTEIVFLEAESELNQIQATVIQTTSSLEALNSDLIANQETTNTLTTELEALTPPSIITANIVSNEALISTLSEQLNALDEDDPVAQSLQQEIQLLDENNQSLSQQLASTTNSFTVIAQELETVTNAQSDITNQIEQTKEQLKNSQQTLIAAQGDFDSTSSELKEAAETLAALQGQLDAAQQGFESEIALLQTQFQSLDQDQLDALSKALNDTVAKGDILSLSSSDLTNILNGGYDAKQINDLIKAYEEEAKFLGRAEKLVLNANETGNVKLLDRAQKMLDKALSQKQKFMEKVDRRGLKNAQQIANEASKEAIRASKEAAKAAKEASKEAAKVAKEEAKSAAKRSKKN